MVDASQNFELDEKTLSSLSIFPLPDAVLLPHMLLPLHVFEPRYRALVRDALDGDRVLAVARLKPGFESAYAGRPAVFEVCGVGRITHHMRLEDGRHNIVLRGIARARIVREHPPDLESRYRKVHAVRLADTKQVELPVALAWRRELMSAWQKLRSHLSEQAESVEAIAKEGPPLAAFTDLIAAAVVEEPNSRQRLLEEQDAVERLRLLVENAYEQLARFSSGNGGDRSWN